MVVLALAFGCFFGLNVLTPMWLQSNMGYTTTWAGIVVAWGGILSVVFSPIAANLSNRVDPALADFHRLRVVGLRHAVAGRCHAGHGSICHLSADFCYGCGDADVLRANHRAGHGLGRGHEMASAAGLMNFVRTIAGAFATSLVTTFWQDRRYIAHDQLSSIVDPTGQMGVIVQGLPAQAGQFGRELLDYAVQSQSLMLATNGLMMVIGVIFFISAFAIALAPKPARTVDAASVGH